MVSSGRAPTDSGPQSLIRDLQTLNRTLLLICGALERSLLISKAAIWERLSYGCVSASREKKPGKGLKKLNEIKSSVLIES